VRLVRDQHVAGRADSLPNALPDNRMIVGDDDSDPYEFLVCCRSAEP
jgi:hypothetical protein